MAQPGEDVQSLEAAAQRFRQGMCPNCGKGTGEPRGLEYRARSEDLYCHTCRKSWPIELDLDILRRELSSLTPERVSQPPTPMPGAVVESGQPPARLGILAGLVALLRRVLRG